MSAVSFARGYENRLSERGIEEYHRYCRMSIRLRAPPCMSDSSSISCPIYGEAFRGKSVSVNTVQSDAHGGKPIENPDFGKPRLSAERHSPYRGKTTN